MTTTEPRPPHRPRLPHPTPPPPPPPPPPGPLEGPYDAANGRCPYGDPVNPYGRCENLNSVPVEQTRPPGCPTRQARRGELESRSTDALVVIATAYGIPIPNVMSDQ